MKNLIILIVFILSVYSLNAQSLSYTKTHHYYNGTTADQTTATDSTLSYSVFKLTDGILYPTIDLKLDSVSGAAASVTVYLNKKMFETDSYTPVDTVTWSASTSDTVVRFTVDVSRERFWQWTTISADNAFIYGLNYTNFLFLK